MTRDLEPEIQALGRRLLKADEDREPIVLSPRWWQERLLELGDRRPRLSRQAPALRRRPPGPAQRRRRRRPHPPVLPRRRARHRRGRRQPLAASRSSGPSSRASCARASTRWRTASSPARRRRAPSTASQDLRRDGIAYTVDLLGEATLSEAEADAYARRYADLIDDAHRTCAGSHSRRLAGRAAGEHLDQAQRPLLPVRARRAGRT